MEDYNDERKTSPVPIIAGKANTLDFYEALKQIAAGKKITKLEWGNNMVYGVLKNGVVSIFDGKEWHTWAVNDGDLAGKDFIVLEEKVPVNNLTND